MHGKVRTGRYQKIQLPTGTHWELLDCDLLRYSRQMEVIELAKRVGVDIVGTSDSTVLTPYIHFPPSRAGDFNLRKVSRQVERAIST